MPVSMLRCSIVACLGLVACSSSPKSDTGSAAKQAPNVDEAAILASVLESQEAGHERNDLAGYLAPWSARGRLVMARAEKPGPHDVVLDRASLEARAKITFSGPASGTVLVHQDPKIEIEGDEAVIRVRTQSVYGKRLTAPYDTVEERYVLAAGEGGWKIVENRFWMVESKFGDELIRFDAAYWKKLDDAIEALPETASAAERGSLLRRAFRVSEAYDVLAPIRSDPNTSADTLFTFGWVALMMGKSDETLEAYRRAYALDPKLPVPAAARD